MDNSKPTMALVAHDNKKAEMVDFGLPVIAKVIESQTVSLFIDNTEQLVFQLEEFGIIKISFKNRILNSLSVVDTGFGDISQPFLTGASIGLDVIRY